MTNYHRGYLIELLAAKELQQRGYSVARCGGSKSVIQGKHHFPFDLIAINKKCTRLLQLKRVKGKYYSFNEDIQKIKRFKANSKCSKELWLFGDRMQGRKSGWVFKKIIE